MKKTKHDSIFWVAIVLGAVIGIMTSVAVVKAAGQEAAPFGVSQVNECLGMDIIFLIDQSSSMGGEDRWNPIPNSNDPRQLRIDASKFVLDWLASNKLGLCRDVVHQIAIISFGETVVQDLHPTIIDPNDFSSWQSFQQELSQKIVPHNLGATDHALAFESAADLFNDFTSVGGAPRKRVVVMLTDGQSYLERDDFILEPYLEDLKEQIETDFPFADVLLEREEMLDDIIASHNGEYSEILPEEFNLIAQEYAIEDLEQAYQESTYIWIAAINDESNYLRSVGKVFDDIATSHGGDLINLGRSANDISLQFNMILSRLGFIPIKLLGCGTTPVEPYLSGAVMDIFAVGEDIEVRISHTDPSQGNQVFTLIGGQGTPADLAHFGLSPDGYSNLGSVEHYFFENPPGGNWEIDATNCDDVKLTLLEFDARVSFAEGSVVPQCPNCEHPPHRPGVKLQIGIEDQQSDPANPTSLKEDPNYPLTAVGEFTDPDGNYVGSVSFSLDPSNPGKMISDTAVPARLEGIYSFDIKATSACIDPENYESEECQQPGDTFKVFETSGFTYEVKKVEEVNIVILEPGNGQQYPLHKMNGLLPPELADPSIRIQIEDSNGNILPISQVVLGNTNPFDAATLTYRPTSQIYDLTFAASGSELVGQLPLDIQFESGEYVFHIEPGNTFVNAINFQSYGIADADLVPRDITFTLADTYVTAPWFYWVKVAIAGIIAIAILSLIIYLFSSPVRGNLEFYIGDSPTPNRVSIKTALRSKTVKKGIPATAGVVKVKVSNAGSRGVKQLINAEFHMNQGNVLPHILDAGGNPKSLGAGVKAGYQWSGKAIGGGGGKAPRVPGRTPPRAATRRTPGPGRGTSSARRPTNPRGGGKRGLKRK
jgi:hypothetical protein